MRNYTETWLTVVRMAAMFFGGYGVAKGWTSFEATPLWAELVCLVLIIAMFAGILGKRVEGSKGGE